MLYSAAGNSADENYYKRGIIGYSFEAGAQRHHGQPDDGRDHAHGGRLPAVLRRPGHAGGPGTACGTVAGAEPAAGQRGPRLHDGVRRGQLRHDPGRAGVPQRHHGAADDDRVLRRSRPSGDPINFKFNWVGEPVDHLLHDRRLDAGHGAGRSGDGLVDERCTNTTATKCYNNQGPRMPGEVLTLGTPAPTPSSGSSVDIKGNREAVKSQRLLVAADDADGTPGGTVPATLSLSLGTPAAFGPFTPGVPKDYTAGTTANVISTAGDANLSVADPSSTNTGHLMNGAFFLPQKLQATASSNSAARPRPAARSAARPLRPRC